MKKKKAVKLEIYLCELPDNHSTYTSRELDSPSEIMPYCRAQKWAEIEETKEELKLFDKQAPMIGVCTSRKGKKICKYAKKVECKKTKRRDETIIAT